MKSNMKNQMKRLWISSLLATLLFVPGAAFSANDTGEQNRSQAEEITTLNDKVFIVDVFWSMRSPYCYIALDRMIEYEKKYNIKFNIRPVWPIAFWDPDFFKHTIEAAPYRVPYQELDPLRVATYYGMPYQYPSPDPIRQEPNFGKILPLEKQDLIQTLTYGAVVANEQGKGLDYLNQVTRMLWNGSVKDWDKGTYLHDAIQRAGFDADAMLKDLTKNADKYDAMVKANHEAQLTNVAGHTGVPNFVYAREPFFGQDRMDLLIWRLKSFGMTERTAH